MSMIRYLVADLTEAVAERQVIAAEQTNIANIRSAASKAATEKATQALRKKRWKLLDKHFTKHDTISRQDVQKLLGNVSISTANNFLRAETTTFAALYEVQTRGQAKRYAKATQQTKEAA